MTVPPELRQLYKQGRLVPFVGAGVSRSVEWLEGGQTKRGVSWNEMVEQATRILGITRPDLLRVRGTDLQILEYFKLKHEDVAPLTHWMFAEMRPDDDALRGSAIHAALASLEKCPVIYTTNYDDFIERSFGLHGRPCQVVATESQMGLSRPSIAEVVKFHGDFNHPKSMVVTESDYQERLSFKTPLDFKIRSDLLGRAALFLGYGFRDPNVAYLFHLIGEQLKGLAANPTGRRAYIASPDPSDFEVRLFRARNIEVIPITGERMTADIVSLLQDLRR